jgi:uncharacterized protein YqgV (UPF0045/DUF77 family)
MGLVAEFTVEPFVPGEPGHHVTAAIEAARSEGATIDIGPFATLISGDDGRVLDALDAAVRAALAAGATRVSSQVMRD